MFYKQANKQDSLTVRFYLNVLKAGQNLVLPRSIVPYLLIRPTDLGEVFFNASCCRTKID